MALVAGQTAIMGTIRLRLRRDVPADPQARVNYVDERVLWLGKQGFISFENERGEGLCSRCLQPLGKDDMTFCAPCHGVLDGILAASHQTSSIPAVS